MFKIALSVNLRVNDVFYSGSFRLLCNQCHAYSGCDQHQQESEGLLCFGNGLNSSCQPYSVLADGIVALLTYFQLFLYYSCAGKVRRYLNIQPDNCLIFCLVSCNTDAGVAVVLGLPLHCLAVSCLELAHCLQGNPSMLGLIFDIWKHWEGQLA